MKQKTKIYNFNDWLKWLNKKQIKINVEHINFKEHYQNLKTFENNYRNYLVNYILTYAGDEIETKKDYINLATMSKKELLNNIKSIKEYYKNN